jgi:hypothetical protein
VPRLPGLLWAPSVQYLWGLGWVLRAQMQPVWLEWVVSARVRRQGWRRVLGSRLTLLVGS